MRIVSVVLFAFATMNISGCKDTPDSLNKKLDELEGELQKVQQSTSRIAALKQEIKLEQGEKVLKPEVVKKVKEGIKQIEADIKKAKATKSA